MGRGRKPKPTRLKILHGNPGKRPLPENEPQPAVGLPEPPDDLPDSAKQVWRDLAGQLVAMGVATQADAISFEMLCRAYADYLAACKRVAKFGAVWLDKSDSPIPKFSYSPYWCVMNREWSKLKSMLSEFGLTPSSRSKVSTVAPTDSTEEQRYFG